MEKKKNFAGALESFFAGKGFYIVLFLCVAVIGISAWTMLSVGVETVDEALPYTEPSLSTETDLPEEDFPLFAEGEEVIEEIAPVINMDAGIAQPEVPADAEPIPTPAATAAPAPAVQSSIPSYFIRPVAGQIENGYSMDALVYNRTMRDWRTHDGLDIAAELGAQVKAVADGTVEKVYSDDAMGTTVVLAHSGGLRSVYSNLAESPTVKEGEAVAGGSVIGSVGTTALCETGEVHHLHFAMSLNGKSVDPAKYLP
ncbi:MAG: M23 family metallopeptidase [Ruminococcaceae bacterium]|nr:M23 family metallopeptidase [Oscillospiraceae bacterium]